MGLDSKSKFNRLYLREEKIFFQSVHSSYFAKRFYRPVDKNGWTFNLAHFWTFWVSKVQTCCGVFFNFIYVWANMRWHHGSSESESVDNILKTFPEIGVVTNTTSLQIWSCKLFDPNRHDAYNAPIQRSLWLQAYAFKRLKNYNKATSFPHSPCSVDMSATFYWKYQGIDNAA